MSTEKNYDAAAAWAEDEMELKPDSTTALRGEAAAQFGQELLRRAKGGRPSIDPDATPGEHSRARRVRLPRASDAGLDAAAKAEERNASAVIRDAVDEYLRARGFLAA